MAKREDVPRLAAENYHVGEIQCGVMDCLFAFGVCLADNGYVERSDLAEAFERLTEDQKTNPEAQHPSRQYPARVLAQLFRLPVIEKTNN